MTKAEYAKKELQECIAVAHAVINSSPRPSTASLIQDLIGKSYSYSDALEDELHAYRTKTHRAYCEDGNWSYIYPKDEPGRAWAKAVLAIGPILLLAIGVGLAVFL